MANILKENCFGMKKKQQQINRHDCTKYTQLHINKGQYAASSSNLDEKLFSYWTFHICCHRVKHAFNNLNVTEINKKVNFDGKWMIGLTVEFDCFTCDSLMTTIY